MNIILRSRSDINGWCRVFLILGTKPAVSLWGIVGIPECIMHEPKYILEIAKFFFTRGGELKNEKEWLPEEEVSDLCEARRMIDLGYLYNCFGRIAFYYGEKNAIALYQWGERNFVHEKQIFWADWKRVFLTLFRKETSLDTVLNQSDYERILDIINNQFQQTSQEKEKLKIEFEKVYQNYSLNPAELELFKNFLRYGLSREFNVDNITEELHSVFHFKLILSQECAYKVWHLINTNFKIDVRKRLFQWGIDTLHSLGHSGPDNKNDMEKYCLGV